VRRAFTGHGADAGGLVLIGLGLLCALGVYGDLAGPAGRAVADAAGAVVGLARVAVPPALVLVGVALVRLEDRDPAPDPAPAARLAVGAALLAVGVTGLLHLAGGRPGPGDGIDGMADAGGLLGAATALPLAGLTSAWGATIAEVTIVLVALLLLTRVSVRVAAASTAAGVRPLARGGRRLIEVLFDTPIGPDGASPTDGRGPTVVVGGESIDLTSATGPAAPFDQDEAGEAAAVAGAPAPRRRRPAAPSEPLGPVTEAEQLHIDLGPAAQPSPWRLPKVDLLHRAGAHEVDRRLVEETGRTLEQALAEHGVETRLVGMVVGPTVTRYELELAPGVKVARVTSLHKDIAYAMATPDVRILAPIPGRQAIGVEVPNARRQLVALGDLLTSPEARRATHPLEVALGRDINGTSVMLNLAHMPHVLIAGATGAGKSSCINSIITSMLVRSTPDQIRMILVDPKRVELTQYAKLPHLLTEVVTDPKKAANALDWAVREMDRRYELLEAVHVRDITGYNAAYDRGDLRSAPGAGETGPDGEPLEYQRLPFIVIVVDELNDLMMVAARDVEASICRIAQKARAVGIHLVLATQRPSVNVITGLIKANIPSRIAFAVSSLADSRVILDQAGAERLIGKGDMLLLGATSSAAQRVQGAWVTEEEVRAISEAWRKQAPELAYVPEVQGEADGAATGSAGGHGHGDDDDDDLLAQAMELVVRSQLGSTSMLQRKLRVGFARAGRLMDLLEQRGVVGPSEGSKARAVLMTPEELDGTVAPDPEE